MFTQIMSFAMSVASRGLADKVIDLPTKKLRYISCFGLDDISPCQNLQKSSKSDYHYCSACKCGDHSHTWLQKTDGEYSKLDYPFLKCPLSMPGFNNYDPNNPKESLERKKQIESLNPEKLNLVNLTVSVDKEKEKIFERVANIIENS